MVTSNMTAILTKTLHRWSRLIKTKTSSWIRACRAMFFVDNVMGRFDQYLNIYAIFAMFDLRLEIFVFTVALFLCSQLYKNINFKILFFQLNFLNSVIIYNCMNLYVLCRVLFSPWEHGYSPQEIWRISQEIWSIIHALMSHFHIKVKTRNVCKVIPNLGI